MFYKITQTISHISATLRLMVGMPNYDTYVAHMKNTHPDQIVITYSEFFRKRQESRYGGNGKISRCC